MQTVRAKFYVGTVTPGTITDAQGNTVGKTITLNPVTSGSVENEQFYKMTPGGAIQLSTVNEDAAAQFEPGRTFYVDFTPAES
jgi:hypothetical protein